MNHGLLPLDRWLLERRARALGLAGALAGSVLIIWIVIQSRGAFPGDSHLVSWMLFPEPSEPFARMAHLFAWLGHPFIATVTVAVLWAIVTAWVGTRHGVLLLAAVGAVALNSLLKAIFGPTPLQLSTFGHHAMSNFPSGHVVYATSLCSVLGWFALARGNRPLFAAFVVVMLCMGPSRVVDGSHWPSDVLAGYALGLAWTIAVLALGLRWAGADASERQERHASTAH